MYKGKQVSESEALKIIRNNKYTDPETGRKLKSFKDVNSAVDSARKRSNDIGKKRLKNEK